MCSETSPPRLSFSHDVGQSEVLPIEHNLNRRDSSLLDPDFDFEFRIGSSFEQETCPADELFSNGVLLPVQVKERIDAAKEIHRCEPRSRAPLPPLPCDNSSKKESMKEVMIMNSDLAQKHASKSFWGFRRSTSLNSDSKRSLLCSLPLLLRSNSTGSVSNPKRAALKDVHKQNSLKQASNSMSRASSSSYAYAMQQKPPLKKNYGGSLNGVRISPVLNIVPPPYISKRTENLFGLGSLLRDRKDKRSKK
ncbi:hypothetical protein I3760_15G115700 [Carya illinoinensis]|uniref:Uncharacterized protein n=1 Tax=Carya illinoinensis TaxID=32201 RepID=A0A922A6K3_CARIL|nr:hypothetical protein I3760_15G115700 [Carya illinoinensis]KAG6675724.1 hypothetical protein I3842_15G117700 [Carya illinoinensis]